MKLRAEVVDKIASAEAKWMQASELLAA
jgi:hypothetical protein